MKASDPRTRIPLLATAVCAVLVIGLVGPFSAWPAQVWSRKGPVTVSADKVVRDDLYVSGEDVKVEGTVQGDVFAGGQAVTIEGTVMGDVIAAGQRITIDGAVRGDVIGVAQTVVVNGVVGGSVRVGCQAVQIGGKAVVDGDLLVGAFSVESQSGSRIGGDIVAGAYQALVDGDVDRDIMAALGALQIGGKIGRNVTVQVGDGEDQEGPPPTAFIGSPGITMLTVPVGLTVADGAQIAGKLAYTSKKKADIAPGAKIAGGVTRAVPKVAPGEKEAEPTLRSRALDELRRLVALLLVGLLMIWLLPGWTRALADKIEAKPLPGLGWGIVAFFTFIAATIAVLAITILLAVVFGIATLGDVVKLVLSAGLLSEVVLVIGYLVFVWFAAQIVLSLLGGRWVLNRLQPESAGERVLPLMLGIVILWVLTAIPILGSIVNLLVILLGLGGLWMWGIDKRRKPADEVLTEA